MTSPSLSSVRSVANIVREDRGMCSKLDGSYETAPILHTGLRSTLKSFPYRLRGLSAATLRHNISLPSKFRAWGASVV